MVAPLGPLPEMGLFTYRETKLALSEDACW